MLLQVLSIAKLKKIFQDANVVDGADDRRGYLNDVEFANAVTMCLDHAVAEFSRTNQGVSDGVKRLQRELTRPHSPRRPKGERSPKLIGSIRSRLAAVPSDQIGDCSAALLGSGVSQPTSPGCRTARYGQMDSSSSWQAMEEDGADDCSDFRAQVRDDFLHLAVRCKKEARLVACSVEHPASEVRQWSAMVALAMQRLPNRTREAVVMSLSRDEPSAPSGTNWCDLMLQSDGRCDHYVTHSLLVFFCLPA